MGNNFICSYARTPIGAFQGSLSKTSAIDLGAIVIRSVLEQSSVNEENINEVIMGNVLSANLGQAPARQAAIGAGLGIGKIFSSAAEATARQPEATDAIKGTVNLPLFLLEGVAIIALVVCILAVVL